MSALDDLFDGHYFTDDPHVYIPIDEAQQELIDLRAENARLKEAVEEAEETVIYCMKYEQPYSSNYSKLKKWLKEYGKEATDEL